MDFRITEELSKLQSAIAQLAGESLNPGLAERDRASASDRKLWKAAGKLRLPGLPIDQAQGGRGTDPFGTAIGLEALGYHSADNGFNFAIAAHMLACAVPIWKFGSDELKAEYLPGMCDGSWVCANSITEPSAGSDSTLMQTFAEKVDGGYRINGSKIFITNGPDSDLSLLYAITDREKGFFGGLSAFVIETASPGFKTDISIHKLGLRTAPLGEQVLEDVFVPSSRMLGEAGGGGYIFNHSMEWERALLAAIHVGALQRLMEWTIGWIKKNISRNERSQIAGHKVAEMKVQLEAARLLLYKAADQMGKSRTASMDASISKLYVSEALNRTARAALDITGIAGYSEEDELARQIRDHASATIYSGTSEMQRNIIAKWLGVG